MRIISGKHRGRKLATPPERLDIRPTTDAVREAMFNLLVHGKYSDGVNPFVGANVLDVCSGTGALGLEALSRGADHVTFIDNDTNAMALVKQNVAMLKAEVQVEQLTINATKLPHAIKPYDIILMDPPYSQQLATQILVSLYEGKWCKNNALLMIEHERKEPLEVPDFCEHLTTRPYGRTGVTLLRYAIA